MRQQDLARLVQLAAAFDGDAASFVEDLRRRFDSGGDAAHGVNLLTLHRAKGLEFEAVFIPRLQEKELPSKQARTPAELAEERRLLYVGHDAREARPLAHLVGQAPAVPAGARRRAGARRAGTRAASEPGPPRRREARAPGGSSARRPTRSRPMWSSTTACCTRSQRRARVARRAVADRRASARQSSSATGRTCWSSSSPDSGQRREQQVEHQLRVAAHARLRSRGRASAARAHAGR